VDITSICIANGIDDNRLVKEVIEDSEMDLRRIKRKIYALKNAA
jgi:EAL domain-containing protein (putative c-di-GMP-specific phosphodiesterase class I)